MFDMIESFSSGTTTFLVAKKGIFKKFLSLQLSVMILVYLDAEIDYRPFLLFYLA